MIRDRRLGDHVVRNLFREDALIVLLA